ncbi:GDP-mannose 4,6-dehydratase [Synechococcus sp. CS-1324]|nr:GDP-mannose 4,6-dehydratase [Synechococcus sp. CS-1324]
MGGQDGSILAEKLVAAGRQVLGLGRRAVFQFRIASPTFSYRRLDLTDQDELDRCLEEFEPDEVFHVAAVHGSAGFIYEEVWGSAVDVNTKSLHRVLEYARRRRPELRIFYASSAKIFGSALKGRVDVSTPHLGQCLYSITKKASGQLASHYDRMYGIKTTVAILFNHESERRQASFFIPKICRVVRTALVDSSFREKVQTLSFHCDWSSAHDFMQMAIRAVEIGWGGELNFASGVTWHGRDFARELFARHGLDYSCHLDVPTDGDSSAFDVDVSETTLVLGLAPREDILSLCDRLIASGSPEVA